LIGGGNLVWVGVLRVTGMMPVKEISLAKKLEFWGALGTTLYLAVIAATVANNFDDFLGLKLNELGDFLAGAFGPIAFLWLVLGFLQQGRELKLSTDALRLQADELKASVEQQTKMVESQKITLDNHERSLDPLLVLQAIPGTYDEGGDFHFQFKIINKGAYCENVSITISSEESSFSLKAEPLYDDTYTTFSVGDGWSDKVNVVITYIRVSGNAGVQKFQLTKVEQEYENWYTISKLRSESSR